MGLPGRSLLEIIAEVHQLALDCRIVILTVFEDEKKISRAISAGASGYLVKTSGAETVVAAILEAAEGSSPMLPNGAASVVKMLEKLTKPAVQPVSLSPREHDLQKLLVEGLTAKETADRMQVSIHTTNTHTRNLFTKLGGTAGR